MKYELGGKIMTEFVGLRVEIYRYLIDDNGKNNDAKVAKKSIIKWKLKFEDYKNCLEATKLENKITHLQKNEIDVGKHVFTAEVNRTTLSDNDDKIIQSIDSIETCYI